MRRVLAVLLCVLLSSLLALQLNVGVVFAYYFDFNIAVVPESPSTHDTVQVTISFGTNHIYENPANFSPLSQSGHNLSISIEIYPWPNMLPVCGDEEETYNLGNLSFGLYCFNVDLQVWSGLPGDVFRSLLDSASYSVFFTVETLTITVPDDYAAVQEAVNAANEGDTIFVRNGTYYENVGVNKTLSLVGENGAAVIDGNGTGTAVTVLANDTRVIGFTIQNSGIGIEVKNASRVELRQNNILSNAEGIDVWFSEEITIADNTVIGYTTLWGVALRDSDNCLVIHNEISYRWSVLLVGSNSSSICDNLLFSRNTYGARLSWSYHNLICGNSIFNASWYGLALDYASEYNTIFHNNFLNNTVQVGSPHYFTLNYWGNGCEGNYWLDYNGTDSDGDGIGDTPYVINENNTDPYPLMNPYWNAGDINHDSTVDIFDVVQCASAYGSTPSSPNWNPHCDIAEPYGTIDIFDMVTLAASYGEEYTP